MNNLFGNYIKKKHHEEMSAKIQKELYLLQHPTNCSATKRLFGLTPSYGFGSRMHFVKFYISLAYRMNHTFCIQNMEYLKDYIVDPSSEVCTEKRNISECLY
jgi:hypothetical protein